MLFPTSEISFLPEEAKAEQHLGQESEPKSSLHYD